MATVGFKGLRWTDFVRSFSSFSFQRHHKNIQL